MSSESDMYISPSSPEFFRIDDLLDFSNEDLFSSSTTTTETDLNFPPPPETTTSNHFFTTATAETAIPNFSHDLCVPSDDVAELEWLSTFVDDSSSHFPIANFTTNNTVSVPGKARSKRSKPAPMTRQSWTSSLPEPDSKFISIINTTSTKTNKHRENSSSPSSSSSSSLSVRGRKCTHCASEKTPQWRTGPMGPKTLCNACGVRYKSGRLVPEYRPAASPTFVLTQHSNSHRKVLELRRKKEVVMEDNNSNNCHHEFFHNHHADFKVC